MEYDVRLQSEIYVKLGHGYGGGGLSRQRVGNFCFVLLDRLNHFEKYFSPHLDRSLTPCYFVEKGLKEFESADICED
jgi:hypothetical protein